jgi:hypothetical protein
MISKIHNALLAACFLTAISVPQLAAAQDAGDQESDKAQAPAAACTERLAHVGFIYPISTNGLDAKAYTNIFSFHALAGVSGGEKAFCLSGLTSIIKNDAVGAQIAGLSNHIGGSTIGGQVAGLVNQVNGTTKGAQVAGLVNLSKASTGAQVGGLVNVSARRTTGAQVAGLVNVSGEMTGFQVAGLANADSRNAKGAQVAGLVNTVNDAEGFQLSGLVNNSKNVKGFQFAGLVNRAKNVKGMQLAGLVNVADSSDYALGVVNIIKNGEKSFGLSIDETQTTLVTFRSGGRVLYGIIGLGLNFKSEDPLMAIEAGYGARIPVYKNFRLSAEAVCMSLNNWGEDWYIKSTLRLLPSYTFAHRVQIYAGPTINFLNNPFGSNELVNNYLWSPSASNTYGLYIGVTGGIQVKF